MNQENTTPDLISTLRKAGLTEPQAKGYLALVENGALSPADMAEKIGESRTNGYMIAEKLEKLGLVRKTDDKKAAYAPLHPSQIELLAEKRRRSVQKNEQDVKQNINGLIDMFYAFNEMPGARTLSGIDGIKEVYSDTLRSKNDIYLIRTTADEGVVGVEYLDSYREKRAAAGINTYALTPTTIQAIRYHKNNVDEKMLFHRTFIPDDVYDAPVEIDIYGSKVAFIAFGDTQMATIIDSPSIAEAMRQLHKALTVCFSGRQSNNQAT
jgi:sugar-specific transcriptional regulator TrmB